MVLSSLFMVLCVASQGFALLSIFSSVQDESFLPANLVSCLKDLPLHLTLIKQSLLVLPPGFCTCSSLSDMPFPTLSLSLNITPYLLADSTTLPYSVSREMTAELYYELLRDE